MTIASMSVFRSQSQRGEPEQAESLRISLASPTQIRSWTSGEVKKPVTINYRSFRPERDGLFCQRIFGPERDWECACGKYQGIRYQGITCDRCAVQITHSRVRRTRMGRIELVSPVVHAWFFNSPTSPLAPILGLKQSELKSVIYLDDYVVIDGKQTPLVRGQILSEQELHAAQAQFGRDAFRAGLGAEAIQELLLGLNLPELSRELRDELATTSTKTRREQILRRLTPIESLLASDNRPEWMILTTLPVLPPDLRPLIRLPSGAFACSDLNELYRRIITRNNRLARLYELQAPEVIVHSEKRMLQQAVDALFDNRGTRRPFRGNTARALVSLSEMLTGKQGRFRENLLGKRVDYSARSVIVVNPKLRLHQCGLPKKIALELYQPFVIRRLRELNERKRDLGYNVPSLTLQAARRLMRKGGDDVWDALEHVTRNHPVLLNRAPTLHRLGIQAFEPVLVEGSAIQLHPLVCKGFNADFDGDQMAVHLPLSIEAQVEARTLLMSTHNVFSPANGSAIITPSQDMVMGCYYLTMDRPGVFPGDGMRFASFEEVELALSQGVVARASRVEVRLPEKTGAVAEPGAQETFPKRLNTTVGRVLFNQALPAGLPFYNYPFRAADLARLIGDCHQRLGRRPTLDLLDRVKQAGFEQSTASGLSFAMTDLVTPESKDRILREATSRVEQAWEDYREERITDRERHSQVVEAWNLARETITQDLMRTLADDFRPGGYVNPVHLMAHSGARGGIEQIRQLAGMRGLMARPNGEIIETPIRASFRQGLSVLDYFRSTHGARKGLTDAALKTADAGYLTRKLADVAQRVVVSQHDCGTTRGMVKHLGGTHPARLLVGRVSLANVSAGQKGKWLVRQNQLIDVATAEQIVAAGVEQLTVRGTLTCESATGACQLCYGMDRSTGRMVELGQAVGILAAQSIGEPGTQLTLRAFHLGGTAERDITGGLPRVTALFEGRGTQARRILAQEGEHAAQAHLLREIDAVYARHGVEIDQKHLEVIIAQMFGKVQVVQAGDSNLLPDSLVDRLEFARLNAELARCVKITSPGGTGLEVGAILPYEQAEERNAAARAESQPVARWQRAKRATGAVRLLGVTKAALHSQSFTSAASFQQTVKVLTEAALASRVDPLVGMKENVLLGRLIPAGTGFPPLRRATVGEQGSDPSRDSWMDAI